MIEIQKSPESASILCLTPLYHFSSDAPELFISPGIWLRQYTHYPTILCDDVVAKQLQVHEPDYLLWYDPLLSLDIVI